MANIQEPDDRALDLIHEGWRHLHLQRPLAAHASWQRALQLVPEQPAALEAIDRFQASSELPELARPSIRFREPTDDQTRERWNDAFQGTMIDDLTVAAEIFEELAEEDVTDADAWYNRALCLAWLGNNVAAINALDLYVHLRAVTPGYFDHAAEAWGLAEILRHGGGAEHLADDLSYRFETAWPEGVAPPFEADAELGAVRSIASPIDPKSGEPMASDATIVEWLDRPLLPPRDDLGVEDLPRVRAVVIMQPGRFSCSSLDRAAIEGLERTIEGRLGRGLSFDRQITPLPLAMLDAAAARVRLPDGLDLATSIRLTTEAIEHYYLNDWTEIPRQGLGESLGDDDGPSLRSPREAGESGNPVLQAKLEGIILLREQLSRRPGSRALYQGFSFDRLRINLGLEPSDPVPEPPAASENPQ